MAVEGGIPASMSTSCWAMMAPSRPELLEVRVLRTAFFSLHIDDGIVLVGCQLALPTPRRCENQDRIGHGRRAVLFSVEPFLGQLGGPARHGADFGAYDRRDRARIDFS